jgi:hypothetical protein
VHIDQAEKAIGATVAILNGSAILIGRIAEIRPTGKVLVWVDSAVRGTAVITMDHAIRVHPHDLVFYYGPLMVQMVKNSLMIREHENLARATIRSRN